VGDFIIFGRNVRARDISVYSNQP